MCLSGKAIGISGKVICASRKLICICGNLSYKSYYEIFEQKQFLPGNDGFSYVGQVSKVYKQRC